jgi:hypothetical protein
MVCMEEPPDEDEKLFKPTPLTSNFPNARDWWDLLAANYDHSRPMGPIPPSNLDRQVNRGKQRSGYDQGLYPYSDDSVRIYQHAQRNHRGRIPAYGMILRMNNAISALREMPQEPMQRIQSFNPDTNGATFEEEIEWNEHNDLMREDFTPRVPRAYVRGIPSDAGYEHGPYGNWGDQDMFNPTDMFNYVNNAARDQNNHKPY